MIQHTPLRKSPYNHSMKGILDSSRDYPGTVGRKAFHQCVPGGKFEMLHVDSSFKQKGNLPQNRWFGLGCFPLKWCLYNTCRTLPLFISLQILTSFSWGRNNKQWIANFRLSLRKQNKDVENLRQIVFFLHPPRGPGDPLRLASSNSSCTAEAGASGDHKLGRPSWPSKSSWGSCNVALPLRKGLGCWDWGQLEKPQVVQLEDLDFKRGRGTTVCLKLGVVFVEVGWFGNFGFVLSLKRYEVVCIQV